MRITSEDQLLDPVVRKKLIQEIEGTENRKRKADAYKRYQCYKDQTYIYVINELLKQFDSNTVNEMSYAVANISLTRKVIDKLARVYKYGVEREMEGSSEAVKAVENLADFNNAMKKTNRFFKLFKNTALYIRPMPVGDKLAPKLTPLPPYLYDVVEFTAEREKPMAFILSNYKPELNGSNTLRPNTDGRTSGPMPAFRALGDNIDQAIADSPQDEQSGLYVFWTASYHFTCDKNGEIVETGDSIGELPFVNFAEDQDGSFWAIGGDDLIDGSILVNSMITNIMHIAVTQGYGQIVLTGKDLPQLVKVGPNKAIRLTYEGEDPKPEFEFKSANPPLDQLRALVEMYVALLLTTNNLSTSGVQSNLNGTASFPSGIAMMIDKAESMEDVEDQRQIFSDSEKHIWRIYAKWWQLLKGRGELPEELAAADLPIDPKVTIRFTQPKAIETERERLEVLKLKRDMGIISAVDVIKAEWPTMTDEQAEDKLREILEEKMKRMEMFTNESNRQQRNIDQDDGSDRAGGEDSEGDARGSGRVPGGADPIEGSES